MRDEEPNAVEDVLADQLMRKRVNGIETVFRRRKKIHGTGTDRTISGMHRGGNRCTDLRRRELADRLQDEPAGEQ